jgi:hypothetical protein
MRGALKLWEECEVLFRARASPRTLKKKKQQQEVAAMVARSD